MSSIRIIDSTRFATVAGLTAAAVMLMLISLPLEAARVYRWVDSAGVAHYSDKPVPQARAVNIERLRNKPVQAEVRLPIPPAIREVARKRCIEAQERLDHYKAAGSIIERDNRGVQHPLSDAQSRLMLKEITDGVDRACARDAARRLADDPALAAALPASVPKRGSTVRGAYRF